MNVTWVVSVEAGSVSLGPRSSRTRSATNEHPERAGIVRRPVDDGALDDAAGGPSRARRGRSPRGPARTRGTAGCRGGRRPSRAGSGRCRSRCPGRCRSRCRTRSRARGSVVGLPRVVVRARVEWDGPARVSRGRTAGADRHLGVSVSLSVRVGPARAWSCSSRGRSCRRSRRQPLLVRPARPGG